MGKVVIVLLLFSLLNVVRNKVPISDMVTEDTSFYYRQFQMFPSKLITLEYSVMFNISKIYRLCGRVGCIVLLDIYTTEYDKNLKINCSNDPFGQLRNENLRTPLRLRHKPYRYTDCKLDDEDPDMLHCEGNTTIQDYIPRHYGFSFGYDCDISAKPSLVGLSYNFTISGQSNRTQCLPIPHHLPRNMKNCVVFYNQISLPNLIGNPDIKSVQVAMSRFEIHLLDGIISDVSSLLPTGGCYKHMKEVFCRISIPQCDQIRNQVIHICKETCFILLNSCVKLWKPFLSHYLKSAKFEKFRKYGNISDLLNCNYLPSVNDPIPCYYKPVTCDPPANVTNARIIYNSEFNGTFLAMSQVEYECVDETFQMEGNQSVTCMYSGKWYETPKCLKREKRSHLNPLSIVLPILVLPLLIFILTRLLWKYICSKKTTQEYFTRIEKYDAFVCYDYNKVDEDFAENRIKMELEEKCDPPFKLCLHRRDFKAAWDIMWNIRNAIQNSNSAIIVMSQEFVNSSWCKEEFEQCYMEHMKDPAFKIFVIYDAVS